METTIEDKHSSQVNVEAEFPKLLDPEGMVWITESQAKQHSICRRYLDDGR